MKEWALEALALAGRIFPPLADMIGDALSRIGDDDPHKPLADEVRERLPQRGQTRQAIDKADGKEG